MAEVIVDSFTIYTFIDADIVFVYVVNLNVSFYQARERIQTMENHELVSFSVIALCHLVKILLR